ncbi:MAG: UDPglucose--hexose-phosphate uridylyltransferase [Moorella sp. (in: firmicutes)]|uniref:Galactose-1-phosphate uridylyltransferase n=1 Tax=Neomoorella thermoacetica TaxID=1525 RepID=A0A1J5P658_NEOTH|nr:UDPglucose--hexose-phosphate uridylyltransferase [Moorella sp. (in: firmicutes)]OIQ60915.1 galactose-1-phosphate uridylyltransferase [Moorella thermoacetica]
MPELRQDPVSQRWVIIATERAKRPSDFKAPYQEKSGSTGCPFCPGHERETPPEVLAFRAAGTAPDTPGWQVRVVPNKFAALAPGDDVTTENSGLYRSMNGTGAHEVIIEGPDHNTFFPDMAPDHAVQVFKAWRQRYLQLSRDKKLQYIQFFKNHGRTAGASLEHPHSQLIATPLVPVTVSQEMDRFKSYWQEQESCLLCDVVEAELEAGARVTGFNSEFLAFCPFASRFPMETWIVPRRHQAGFGDCDDVQLEQLAAILQETLVRLKKAADDPPFNLVLHTAPLHQEDVIYHWYLELLPRLAIVAGFEWGTGMYINPTPPEIAAQSLNEIKLDQEGPAEANRREQP